jgi:hypothetical protein
MRPMRLNSYGWPVTGGGALAPPERQTPNAERQAPRAERQAPRAERQAPRAERNARLDERQRTEILPEDLGGWSLEPPI